jgi:carbon storage regulator
MLVLSRKQNQDIIIGPPGSEIVIRIMSFRDGKVRVGINAPENVPVDREEIFREKHGYGTDAFGRIEDHG